MSRSSSVVDTSSFLFKVCLHETAHAVIARQFGWRATRIERDKDGGWNFWATPPTGLDPAEHARRHATWLLAGPAASLRVSLFLPSGCGWDTAQAKKVLRRARAGSYAAAKADAERLVGRHWNTIQREAHGLYRAGGEWR